MKTLEICITDFCNLQCKNCGQGTPWHKSKKAMSVDHLLNISKFFKANEFEIIKVSGNEPTLHKEFADICNSLKSLFPANKYYLATNGFNLGKYLSDIKIFDRIDVSCYPGQNDDVFNTLAGQNIQNASSYTKNDDVQMFNINAFLN